MIRYEYNIPKRLGIPTKEEPMISQYECGCGVLEGELVSICKEHSKEKGYMESTQPLQINFSGLREHVEKELFKAVDNIFYTDSKDQLVILEASKLVYKILELYDKESAVTVIINIHATKNPDTKTFEIAVRPLWGWCGEDK